MPIPTARATTSPRVAIVGAGVMGRWHAHAARHAGATLVAVADPDTTRAREVAGAAPAVPSLEEALHHRPEVVHICTPLDSHLELCRHALAAGCHVVAEKPVTATAGEAGLLCEQARSAGRLLVPVHQFAFQDGVRRLLAARERLRPIRVVEFATCSAGGERRAPAERDLVAAEIAPHAFALARAFLNIPVGGLAWQLQRPAPGEWRFSASTPDGCEIAGMISLAARPTQATCRVLGEHGGGMADLFQGYAIIEPGTASRTYKVLRPLTLGLRTAGASAWELMRRAVRREPAYPGLRRLVRQTYDAIAGRGQPPFAEDEIVDVALGRERLLALARSRD